MKNLENLKRENRELLSNMVVAVETVDGLKYVNKIEKSIPTGIVDFCEWAKEKAE